MKRFSERKRRGRNNTHAALGFGYKEDRGVECQHRESRKEEVRPTVSEGCQHDGRHEADNAERGVSDRSTGPWRTYKLDIQVQDVVMLIPVDRRASGNISLGRTQPMGAQE